MNLSTKQKQTHRHREQTCGGQGERALERDGWGLWDSQMQGIIQRINNQVLIYSTRNYIQYSMIIEMISQNNIIIEKNMKKDVYISMFYIYTCI